MGVYIKGIEMPRNCEECFLVGSCIGKHWEITKDDMGYKGEYVKDNCSLIEVPEPHGRLIDADACIDYIRNNNQHAWETLAHAPIVIERSNNE